MEELIIRVKIDGMGGGSDSNQNRSATRNENGALAAGAIGLALNSKKPLDILNYKAWNQVGGNTYAYQDRTTQRIAKEAGLNMSNVGLTPGTYGGYRDVMLSDDEGSITQTQETLWGKIGGAEFLQNNGRQIKAGASAMAWKVANSAVAIQQHRSGDSYANAQLSNAMKFAGYGTALAMSGPAAPFVAAGIVINEVANAVVQSSNYRFDRRQDSNKIQNIQIIAGNISYGRNRGAY